VAPFLFVVGVWLLAVHCWVLRERACRVLLSAGLLLGCACVCGLVGGWWVWGAGGVLSRLLVGCLFWFVLLVGACALFWCVGSGGWGGLGWVVCWWCVVVL
jgi:hypothetical protein